MPLQELEYPKEAINKVKRLSDRASYALETIHRIINSSSILNVSFQPPDSPFPVILPMIGLMGSFARPSADLGDVLDLYLHGYVSARMMNLSRTGEKGMPVCVSASFNDGLVLALSAFHNSYNYRSACLFGHAMLVTDEAEKMYALGLITDSVVPGRWDGSRLPPTGGEMQSTSILKVSIATGSAKVRTGTPHDDKADMDDAALVDRVWTGVVPVYQVMGEPIPSSYNKVKEVPAYIKDYIKDFNKDSVELAKEATIDPPPKAKVED